MFAINDTVIYRKLLCRITDIKTNTLTNEEYYMLQPINDTTTKIQVPVKNLANHLRSVITKEKIDELLPKINELEPIQAHNMKNDYTNLLKSDDCLDLFRIIKTAYANNEARAAANKKLSSMDDAYLKEAEMYVYTEFSHALNMSVDETREYLIRAFEKLNG